MSAALTFNGLSTFGSTFLVLARRSFIWFLSLLSWWDHRLSRWVTPFSSHSTQEVSLGATHVRLPDVLLPFYYSDNHTLGNVELRKEWKRIMKIVNVSLQVIFCWWMFLLFVMNDCNCWQLRYIFFIEIGIKHLQKPFLTQEI